MLEYVTMKKMKNKALALLIILNLFILFITAISYADSIKSDMDMLKENAPKVFLDCWRCDRDYIRTNVTFVNYVRDRQIADIHILVTIQRTGPGGREYTMNFIGQNDFSHLQHILKYFSNRTDAWDTMRKGFVEVLKKGLFPFMVHTPFIEHFKVDFQRETSPMSVLDKWNFWVYSVSLRGSIRGQSTRRSVSMRGNLSANRVTPDMKIRLGLSGNFDETRFDIEDETIVSTSESRNLWALFVKSISDHWSVGASFGISRSTYNNIDLSINPAPAVEYNVFPYSESTRRQLRFLYRIGYAYNKYYEETIYEKIKEHLFGQSLNITFGVREPWGNAEIDVEGSTLFHDVKLNHLRVSGELNLRLFQGFSLNLDASYSQIHDQITLPKGGATLDEILLARKILATDFSYDFSVGFSYTFGSIYSNVVNPRFGR